MVLYDWMDIPRDSAVLPEPLPTNKTGTREYWSTIKVEGGEKRILRPGWADTWTDNEIGWARQLAESIQKDGARWNSVVKQDELTGLPVATIVNSIRVTHTSWVKAYKKSKKPVVDQSLVKQRQRRNGRKVQVCNCRSHVIMVLTWHFQKANQRAKYRVDVPEAIGPEWAFLKETIYQSTDESDEDSLNDEDGNAAVDPDTEDEGPISRHSQKLVKDQKSERRNKVVSQKPYVSRPPTYRAREVSDSHCQDVRCLQEGLGRLMMF